MGYKKIIFAVTLAWMLALPLISFAAEEGMAILERRGLRGCLIGIPEPGLEKKPQEWKTPPGSCSVEQILIFAGNIIDWLVGIAGAIALFMFVIGGSWMIFSAGNSSRVERGKDILTGTTVALMYILGSWVIIQFVLQGLGSRYQLADLQCGPNNECPANTTCIQNKCRDKCFIDHGSENWSCQEAPGTGASCAPNICRNQGDVCCPPQQ